MNVDHINPIYKATNQVFKSMFQLDVDKGEMDVKDDIIPTKDVNVIIGINGELNGTILFSFPEELALQLVEDMAGMEMSEVDKFVASAIGELGNIISGNAMSNFSKENYNCDIVPPQVNIGENKTYSTATDKVLVIPLKTNYGEFDLTISIGSEN